MFCVLLKRVFGNGRGDEIRVLKREALRDLVWNGNTEDAR